VYDGVVIHVTADDRVLCDGCGDCYNGVYLIVMGDYFDRIWSYVFCSTCVINIHNNWVWMQKDPTRSINVTVRGQNISVHDLLIWGEQIYASNAALYNLPDYAIQG
jgi:hypothetical protein